MHICIIGTGASGWIACTKLKNLKFIKKITIIGSSKIPSIGVGESTSLNFKDFCLDNIDLKKFVRESDATVKYGVYYKNWSKRDFIHYFESCKEILRSNIAPTNFGKFLANKDKSTHIHDLIGNKLWNFIQKNQVSLDTEEYVHSWHFDAGKFIEFLKKENINDPKVNFVDDTIVDCKYSFKENIEYIIGNNNQKYFADYFVNCCGDNELNEKIFNEKYISLSSYLLTDKALFYPLKYTKKEDQFHPYTVAKTMKHGWRWITPTQSRIGTGYVFSSSHTSVDEAKEELIKDIGQQIEPRLVDFNPKYNEKPFKLNNCTIGMSSGFLEPLDAPGLTISLYGIDLLIELLEHKRDTSKIILYSNLLTEANFSIKNRYEWWCSFILNQYKTCWREDTQFWIDHKNVECPFYEQIINSLGDVPEHLLGRHDYMMFYLTTAAKDVQWKTKDKSKPTAIKQLDTKTVHHLEYVRSFYN